MHCKNKIRASREAPAYMYTYALVMLCHVLIMYMYEYIM